MKLLSAALILLSTKKAISTGLTISTFQQAECNNIKFPEDGFHTKCRTGGKLRDQPTTECRKLLRARIAYIAKVTLLKGFYQNPRMPGMPRNEEASNVHPITLAAATQYFLMPYPPVAQKDFGPYLDEYLTTTYHNMGNEIPSRWRDVKVFGVAPQQQRSSHPYYLNVFGIYLTYKCHPWPRWNRQKAYDRKKRFSLPFLPCWDSFFISTCTFFAANVLLTLFHSYSVGRCFHIQNALIHLFFLSTTYARSETLGNEWFFAVTFTRAPYTKCASQHVRTLLRHLERK